MPNPPLLTPLAPLGLLVLALAGMPGAASAADDHAHHAPAAASAPAAFFIDGVVRKVDRGAGKLTLWHGEVPQMQMGPMTMVFRVQDVAWLDRYKPGDKVRFQYQRRTDGLIVTALEPAR